MICNLEDFYNIEQKYITDIKSQFSKTNRIKPICCVARHVLSCEMNWPYIKESNLKASFSTSNFLESFTLGQSLGVNYLSNENNKNSHKKYEFINYIEKLYLVFVIVLSWAGKLFIFSSLSLAILNIAVSWFANEHATFDSAPLKTGTSILNKHISAIKKSYTNSKHKQI